MRASIEQRFRKLNPEDQHEFNELCENIFSKGQGREMLEMLCQLSHPCESPLRESATDTAAEVGMKEVIMFLWRRAQFPPEAKIENQSHES